MIRYRISFQGAKGSKAASLGIGPMSIHNRTIQSSGWNTPGMGGSVRIIGSDPYYQGPKIGSVCTVVKRAGFGMILVKDPDGTSYRVYRKHCQVLDWGHPCK